MIEIWEPRWHDRTVLIAAYRVKPGEDVEIEIMKSAFKGRYIVPYEVIEKAPVEKMKTKKGGEVKVIVVSLDDIVPLEGE